MKKHGNGYWNFLAVWYIVGAMINFLMLIGAIFHGHWELLIILALWWAVTITGRKIRHSIEKRRKAKEQEALRVYKEMNITEIPIYNELFGKIVFEHDTKKNTVSIDEAVLKKPLGRHTPTLTVDMDGSDVMPAAMALSYVFEHQEELLEEMYEYTLEACELYDEHDKDGNPYDLAYVRGNLTLYSIHIGNYDDSIYVSLNGSICGDDGNDLLGCHGICTHLTLSIGEKVELKKLHHGLEG